MSMEHITGNFYKDFSEGRHDYFLIEGGKSTPLTGVTTVGNVLAKPQLIGWAARMAVEFMEKAIMSGEYDLTDKAVLGDLLDEAKNAHTKKKEDAGKHGTDKHSIVETWITTCLEKSGGRPEVFAGWAEIDKFVAWAQENVDRFLFSERTMHSPTLYVAGTADFGYIDKQGRRMMGDFKTSSGIYGIAYWAQVAAYRLLAEEEGDESYAGSTIVRHGKDNTFEVQQSFDYENDKSAFLAMLTLYRAIQKSTPVK